MGSWIVPTRRGVVRGRQDPCRLQRHSAWGLSVCGILWSPWPRETCAICEMPCLQVASSLRCPVAGGGGELVPLESPPRSGQQLPGVLSAVRSPGGRASEVTWWWQWSSGRIGRREDAARPGCAGRWLPGAAALTREEQPRSFCGCGPLNTEWRCPRGSEIAGGGPWLVSPSPQSLREAEAQASGGG